MWRDVDVELISIDRSMYLSLHDKYHSVCAGFFHLYTFSSVEHQNLTCPYLPLLIHLPPLSGFVKINKVRHDARLVSAQLRVFTLLT